MGSTVHYLGKIRILGKNIHPCTEDVNTTIPEKYKLSEEGKRVLTVARRRDCLWRLECLSDWLLDVTLLSSIRMRQH